MFGGVAATAAEGERMMAIPATKMDRATRCFTQEPPGGT